MDTLAATLGKTTWDLLPMLAPPALAFGILALVLKRGRVAATIRRTGRETRTNLALVGINYVLLASVLAGIAAMWEKGLAAIAVGGPFWHDASPVLVLAVTMLVGEFVVYWRHRIEHHPLLWPVHAVHHSDEAMTWLALLRKHPLAYVLAMFVDTVLLLLLGLPLWAIAACAAVRSGWGYFIHADLPWTFGPLGRWLISPAAHRLHHIDDLELCGSNYGGVLTLWDRVFGTYIDPAPFVDCRTGVDGGSRGFLGELARPFAAWAGSRRVDAPREIAEA
ncbi:sterol desaturase family protein [Parerythrobacter aurantius]|uniref:sterol desaturase family protein n=1 Tax=Parerythrobacter aurantius TaxID=3127706 RepID=UPI0032513A1E